jgi:putative NIF3 family GTP cyclohydrolase 1 type 2
MLRNILLTLLLTLGASINCSAITAQQLIDRIIKNATGSPFEKTVDVFKEGNPDDEVTGVIVCMFATMDILNEAVKNKSNLIIVHEPLYYNHTDETSQFKDDPVVNDKRNFIRQNNLIIWRFHDYAHSIKPDGFLAGMAEKLEWKDYATSQMFYEYKLPETSLEDIIKHLKTKFPQTSLTVVGNPLARISNICFTPGSPGSKIHIQCFTQKNADLVIGGEVQQWETYEYVRDAVAQGKNKSVIFLGHIPSENVGMEYTSRWLQKYITEVPVKFLESGASYRTY